MPSHESSRRKKKMAWLLLNGSRDRARSGTSQSLQQFVRVPYNASTVVDSLQVTKLRHRRWARPSATPSGHTLCCVLPFHMRC